MQKSNQAVKQPVSVKTTDKLLNAGRSLWGFFAPAAEQPQIQQKPKPTATIVIGKSAQPGAGWSFAKNTASPRRKQ